MDERTHARYMADIAYFLSKMEAEPNSGYFIPIALGYNKLEKYDETIAMCKTAVERFPSNCAAKTFLAEAYVYKGLFDQARDLLFDVTAEDDNNYKALKLLGVICKEKGDNTEALKYLTGAFIRAPEDEDVRKMIDELGGTLNPGEIYDERMKRQSQNAANSEEDEDLKTYQEIDKRIRNAEIIMADLVSDTSINARNYEDEDDFHSDNPDDYMPLITQHEEDESLYGEPDDFLPVINQSEESESIEPIQTLESEEIHDDLASALQENNTAEQDEDINNADDLLSALSGEEDSNEISNDLASALKENNTAEQDEDINNTDDLLSALTSEEDSNKISDDLTSALQENNTSEQDEDINNTDDLLSALSGEEDSNEISDDLASALQENNTAEQDEDINDTDDLLSTLASEEDSNEISNDLTSALQENNTAEQEEDINNADDLLSALSGEEENNEISDDLTSAEQENNTAEESIDEKDEDYNNELLSNENIDIDNNDNIANETVIEENDKSIEELLHKQVPSSIDGMTYDDMIDDDTQYSMIVSDNYNDSENLSINLGDSSPFTQGDIMEEILNAVGMTHDDMADDERINLSAKDRKLMRLENFLDKVKHNKENK